MNEEQLDKQTIINELKNLSEAFQRLGFAWSTYNLDNTKAMKHYPFSSNKSVMVSKVNKWVKETIKELE